MFGPTHGTTELVLFHRFINATKKWLDSLDYKILLIFIPNPGKSNFVEFEE